MESISWIFDGLGTEIISLIVGLISGGAIGYKIGIHNRIKQSQKAGNNSRQTQISSTLIPQHYNLTLFISS